MRVLIVGGGKIGKNLAHFLVDQDNHAVTLIERNAEVAHRLDHELSGVIVVEGDGCDPTVLREAGIESMDGVAAVTGDDEDNLVVALLSKREFRVSRVAARINNPKNAWLFTRRMGVDVPVDATQMIARSLEADINVGAVVQMLKLREGRATLVELTVAPGAAVIGKPLRSLALPPECVLVTVLRGESVIIPSNDTTLQDGDQILAIAHMDREASLADVFR